VEGISDNKLAEFFGYALEMEHIKANIVQAGTAKAFGAEDD